ncbi:hypothetical protein ACFX2H_022154 [Malus domestica]
MTKQEWPETHILVESSKLWLKYACPPVSETLIEVGNNEKDACGAMGLIPEQKITTAMQMLAYGAAADQVDEIARMRKSTILKSLMRFCRAIESIYTAEYLRKPTHMDLERLLKKAEMRGFPGMIGSIDLFNDILQGKAPKVTYEVSGRMYDGPYYLADGIYLRKDVERCFGILQFTTAIVRGAARLFDVESLRSIMMTCIILHNMMVEDEYNYEAVDEYEPDMMNNSRTRKYCAHDATDEPVQHEPLERDGRYNERVVQRYTAFQRSDMHNARQNDLIEHQWALKQAVHDNFWTDRHNSEFRTIFDNIPTFPPVE